MNQISLITPPDKLYNQAVSVLLIYPTLEIEKEFQKILLNINIDCNVYVYNINNDEHHYNWLLSVHKFCNLCIINLDLLPSELKTMESYFISFPSTYWVSQNNNVLYNKISQNKIYNLDFLTNKLTPYVQKQPIQT